MAIPMGAVLAALLAAGGPLSSQAQSPPCRPDVTARASVVRGLPESFYDQGRESLTVLYPRHRLLAERREGRMGTIAYSLLVFQAEPAGEVVLEAVAVDWERGRGWDLEASCSTESWTGGLIAMLEAIAGLERGGVAANVKQRIPPTADEKRRADVR